VLSINFRYLKQAEDEIKVRDVELRRQSDEFSTREYELKKEISRAKNSRDG
jgi:hypothetical protein